METMAIDDLTLFFDSEEREVAQLISQACEKSARLIHECWGLVTPPDLRVYVMTSWLRPLFHAAPWPWRILLSAALPLWGWRARRLWPLAGGWAQQFGRRRMVGIKPPRLIQASDRSIGERIFVKQENIDSKVQQIACHELTHAFAAHLRLPVWLNEGLAMVTVDRFLGQPTVKEETFAALARSSGAAKSSRYPWFTTQDPDAIVVLYVRGYWLVRYLEETRPGLLKSLLTRRYRHDDLEGRIASAFGIGREEFWREIDGMMAARFAAVSVPKSSTEE